MIKISIICGGDYLLVISNKGQNPVFWAKEAAPGRLPNGPRAGAGGVSCRAKKKIGGKSRQSDLLNITRNMCMKKSD